MYPKATVKRIYLKGTLAKAYIYIYSRIKNKKEPVQYSTVQYTVPVYWSSNQTITVASVSTVTGSAFVRRFRKFLGQCDKDEHLSRHGT